MEVMSEISAKIYNYMLTCNKEVVSMTDLENVIGVPSRGLRSQGRTPGLFRTAIWEIYNTTGWFLVSISGRNGGVRMTKDTALVEYAANRLSAHAQHELDLANTMHACLKDARATEGSVDA